MKNTFSNASNCSLKNILLPVCGYLLFLIFLIFPYFSKLTLNQSIIFYTSVILAFYIWFSIAYRIKYNFINTDNFFWGDIIAIVCILLFLVISRIKQLNLSLTLGGDEHFHILRAFFISIELNKLSPEKVMVLLSSIVLFFIILKYCFYTENKKIFLFFMISFPILAIIGNYLFYNRFLPPYDYYSRYPPFFMIFESFFSNFLLKNELFEISHRMSAFIPWLISAAAIYFSARSLKISIVFSFLSTMTILTIPGYWHYGTLIYIEPLLLSGFIVSIFTLIHTENIKDKIFSVGVFISLFNMIKLTAMPYVLSYFIFSMFILLKNKSSNKDFIIKVSLMFFLLFLPAIPQILIEKFIPMPCLSQNNYLNLIDIVIWKTYFESCKFQLTIPFVIAVIIGIFFGKIKKEILFLSISSIIIYFVFLTRILESSVGMGRYLIYLVPFIFPYILPLPEIIKKSFSKISLKNSFIVNLTVFIFYILIISTNLYYYNYNETFNKKWLYPRGSEPMDVYYPFDECGKFLQNKIMADEKIMLEGTSIYYFFNLYFMKYKIPTSKLIQSRQNVSLQKALETAKQKNCRALIYVYRDPPVEKLINNARRFNYKNNFLDIILLDKNQDLKSN
ncbi:MAG: hypothetical protein ACD_79C00692G0002 [uncultured bacterium]|nr:MAG: hypothetical protein ACD_79C00692G0002 [uncultured bacterium]